MIQKPRPGAASPTLAALRQERLEHVSRDVGQAEVATLVSCHEPPVVETEGVQYGGLDVVDVGRVLDDVPAPLVGLAVRETAAEAAAGEHQAAAELVVIAAVARERHGTFAVARAAEL